MSRKPPSFTVMGAANQNREQRQASASGNPADAEKSSPPADTSGQPEKKKIEIRLVPRTDRREQQNASANPQAKTESPTAGNHRSEQPAAPAPEDRGPAVPPSGTDPRQIILARFIRFCASVFSTSLPQEAAALAVNRISEVVRVDRAVLVRLKGRNPIVAVTGGGIAAQDSSFADAVESVRDRYRGRAETVVVPLIPEEAKHRVSHLWKIQQNMGGTRILWLPLRLSHEEGSFPRYAMWLERWQNQPWEKGDIELLQHAALFLGHGLERTKTESKSGSFFSRMIVIALVLTFLALPVTSSVTAPARVMPDQPHHIFAPMDGILKELLVRPGQWVKNGDLLFRYDARVLDKRLDEAHRNVAVAKAKLIRLEGASHKDPEARAETPVQELEVQRAEADAQFFAGQRARADVRTARPGVIVLDDPDALIGAALQTGQAVMSVADPAQTKLHIMVPSADAGFLKNGARVAVRLDSNPLRSIPAVITRVGFEIKISEEQIPSVLVEAMWVGDVPDARPGQKGTVKIFGDSTFMGWQILRKPLIILRTVTGF